MGCAETRQKKNMYICIFVYNNKRTAKITFAIDFSPYTFEKGQCNLKINGCKKGRQIRN